MKRITEKEKLEVLREQHELRQLHEAMAEIAKEEQEMMEEARYLGYTCKSMEQYQIMDYYY